MAAGFPRVNDSDNPPDSLAAHPKAYPLAERMLADNEITLPPNRKTA